MPTFSAMFEDDDGIREMVLRATTLEEAKEEVKNAMLNEEDQEFDEVGLSSYWNSDLNEDNEYECCTRAFIVQNLGSQAELPIQEWREQIEQWENEKMKELEYRANFESEQEEFEMIKKRYHELSDKFENDPSVSAAASGNGGRKKPLKKKATKKKATKKKAIKRSGGF